ncbi:protein FAM177B [Cynoglossus semilaevis]|uniref:Protein FAM177B n=1 Tax=Cynoglossus semilaevis TaxID=244447 RepID=A0A3P8VV31_CYNSE|nr:protein FAM177B [Cynoglossus semilaevis]XP_024909455.1 protein FAM177B [Cynoglossus semilaevis]
MIRGHQEVMCSQETEFTGCALAKQKKVIYFTSGETMEEDSEEEKEEEEDEEGEEEHKSNTPPFSEPAEKTRFSFRKLAFLVGRISLLTCDFLGERLANVFGLDAAKYQYAIDQHERDRRTPKSQAKGDTTKARGEMIQLSDRLEKGQYGATGTANPCEPQGSCEDEPTSRKDGYHNRGYQADEDSLK